MADFISDSSTTKLCSVKYYLHLIYTVSVCRNIVITVFKSTLLIEQEESELHADDLPEEAENLKKWNETPINIAITGPSGTLLVEYFTGFIR